MPPTLTPLRRRLCSTMTPSHIDSLPGSVQVSQQSAAVQQSSPLRAPLDRQDSSTPQTVGKSHWTNDKGYDTRTAEDMLYEWLMTPDFDRQWNGAIGWKRSRAVQYFNDMLKDNGIGPRTQRGVEDKVSESRACELTYPKHHLFLRFVASNGTSRRLYTGRIVQAQESTSTMELFFSMEKR